jgi:hypothetical protein
VLAFRKRTNRRPYPFRTFRMNGSKGRETRRLRGDRAGAGRFTGYALILSKTAGARDKRKFFNGLIAWPA